MSTERQRKTARAQRRGGAAANDQRARERPEARPRDPETSVARDPTRRRRSIFGITPKIGGVPAPIIVVGAALLVAVVLVYLVMSRQTPLLGGDTGEGQPVQPEIREEAPE